MYIKIYKVYLFTEFMAVTNSTKSVREETTVYINNLRPGDFKV